MSFLIIAFLLIITRFLPLVSLLCLANNENASLIILKFICVFKGLLPSLKLSFVMSHFKKSAFTIASIEILIRKLVGDFEAQPIGLSSKAAIFSMIRD